MRAHARSMSLATVSAFMTTRICGFLLEESPDAIVTTTPEHANGPVQIRGDLPDRVAQDQTRGLSRTGAAFLARWRVFFRLGFLQLTQSCRRLVRAPPRATAGFCRTLSRRQFCQRTAIPPFFRSSTVSDPLQPGPMRQPYRGRDSHALHFAARTSRDSVRGSGASA
jgi:hypothetical protein